MIAPADELLLWERNTGTISLPTPEQRTFDWIPPIQRNQLCSAIAEFQRVDSTGSNVVNLADINTATHALSTLYGVKPGCSIGTFVTVDAESTSAKLAAIREDPRFTLWSFLQEVGIPSIIQLEWCSMLEQVFISIFIARNERVLDTLPPFHSDRKTSEIESEYQQQWGAFLGVPEPDNGWYSEPTASGPDDVQPLAETTDMDISPSEELFASLTPYAPQPSRDGVQRAVELGRGYAEAVTMFGGNEALDALVTGAQDRLAADNRFTAGKPREVDVEIVRSEIESTANSEIPPTQEFDSLKTCLGVNRE